MNKNIIRKFGLLFIVLLTAQFIWHCGILGEEIAANDRKFELPVSSDIREYDSLKVVVMDRKNESEIQIAYNGEADIATVSFDLDDEVGSSYNLVITGYVDGEVVYHKIFKYVDGSKTDTDDILLRTGSFAVDFDPESKLTVKLGDTATFKASPEDEGIYNFAWYVDDVYSKFSDVVEFSLVPAKPGTQFIKGRVGNNTGYVNSGTIVLTTTANNDLDDLGVSLDDTLDPPFSADVFEYTITLPNDATEILFDPVADNDASTTVTISTDSGPVTGLVDLVVGPNTITITVESEDGDNNTTSQIYTVVVTRLPSKDAMLSDLELSVGTLDPEFDSATTSYSITLLDTVTSIDVTPTTSHSGATLTVNGVEGTSGDATEVTVDETLSEITVKVTAEDSTTTTSYDITVNLLLPPEFSSQPEDVDALEGETATFTASAEKSSAVAFQWYANDSLIEDATENSYTTPTLTKDDDSTLFYVIASDVGGNTASDTVLLTVTLLPPEITTHPADAQVLEGDTAEFEVEATGTDLTYEWYKDGSAIADEDGDTYISGPNVLADDSTVYHVIVSNSGGADTSNSATLRVATSAIPAEITDHPADISVTEGNTATFDVTATGSDLTYQWFLNDTAIVDATGVSHTTPATTLADDGSVFHVVVSNAAGDSTSNSATLTVTEDVIAPEVTSGPNDTTVTEGETATFSVTATGSDLTYQWQTDGVDISGADTDSYTTAATVSGDDGAVFRCIASNSAGADTSSGATLIVELITPVITTDPVDVAVTEGSTAEFTVIATGTDVTYQWQLDNADIGGATSDSYTTDVTTSGDNGAVYRCIVTNTGGSDTSGTATLTVTLVTPVITTDPQDVTETEGSTANFSVVATGTNITYQWQADGADIGGATSDSYTTPATSVADDGTVFRCIVTNSGGSDTSSNATLTIDLIAPAITTDPASITIDEGTTTVFTVVATGTNITYQWQADGADIGGATSNTYTTPTVDISDDGTLFRCIVTNSGGVDTSASATLTVSLLLPVITTDPSDIAVTEGNTAQFTVVSSGTNITYQWQMDGVDIGGATSSSYTTPATVEGDNGTAFRCIVTNTAGSDTSTNATLTVNLNPPVITTHPVNETIVEGNSAVFTVVATGTSISYQWQLDVGSGFSDLGSTNSSHTTPVLGLEANGNVYRCIVTNSGGADTSSGATLSVDSLPKVGVPENDLPAGQYFWAQNITLTPDSAGDTIYYTWDDWANTILYSAPINVNDTLFATLKWAAFNAPYYPSDTASAAYSFIDAIPAITTHPSSQTKPAGETATFTSVTTGTNLSYQWQLDGVDISGANNATYITPTLTIADTGNVYRLIVSNTGGADTSNNATLTVNYAPFITAEPLDQYAATGQTATFSFTAIASPSSPTYQWKLDGNNIAGATNATYTTPATVIGDQGKIYSCEITNSIGTTTTANAVLHVRDDLIGKWDFNGNAKDGSGYGNHGTFSGTAPVLTTDRNSNDNSAYYWADETDVISVADDPILDGHTEFSLSVWFNQDQYPDAFSYLVQKWVCCTATTQSYILGYGFGGLGIRTEVRGGPGGIDSSFAITNGQWHNLVMTFDGNILTDAVKVYYDGALIYTITWSVAGSLTNSTSPLTFGWTNFIGKIDDILMYSRVLNQGEITAIQAGTVP